MAGPDWLDDHPGDAARISANVRAVLDDVDQRGTTRTPLSEDDVRRWHRGLYAGCRVPSSSYVGRLRGDAVPGLVDYEVGVGPVLADGWPERVGVWADEVADAVHAFFVALPRRGGVGPGRPAPG